MFADRRTARLLIRALRPDDAAALAERRNDPAVARYQNWTLPYPRQRAEDLVSQVITAGEPTDGQWWMALICDLPTGEALGDLAVRLSWGGRSAEVGYTLAPRHWGRGYATEALGSLLSYLFEERGIARASGALHPDNTASARVLERSGFVFEGQTKSSYWVGEDCSDDAIYGLPRPDWEAWRARPRGTPRQVALIEIAASNLGTVTGLHTHRTQEAYVPPVAQSLAEALFPPEVNGSPLVPWPRAVTADGEIVGFVMLARRTAHHAEPLLWRLLVDRRHQRRGIGREVLRLVGEECRAMGDRTLLTRWVDGAGSPGRFFARCGFAPAGHARVGETTARLTLG